MKTACLCRGDVERCLELCVEHVEEPVRETPEEEEEGDQSDGEDGLSDCESRGTGEAFVHHAFALLVRNGISVGRLALSNGVVVHGVLCTPELAVLVVRVGRLWKMVVPM